MKLHTRREFLAASGGAGLVVAASSVLPLLAWGEAMGLPPGIQLYTVREDLPKDTPGTLKQLYAIGFREVETFRFVKYTAKEDRKLLDDAGLKVPSADLNMNAADLGPMVEDAHTIGAHYATSSSLAT